MNVELRQRIERRIIRRLIKDAIAAGYCVSVYDGEEITVFASRKQSDVMAAIMTTDSDILLISRPNEKSTVGKVFLVYGNDGWDVINDYSTGLEELLKGAIAVADREEEQHG